MRSMLRYLLIGSGALMVSPTVGAQTPVFIGAECMGLTYIAGGTRWVTGTGKLENIHATDSMFTICPIKQIEPLYGTTEAVVVVTDQNDAKSVECIQVAADVIPELGAQYSASEESGDATVGNFIELEFPSMGYETLFGSQWFECMIPDRDIGDSGIDSYRTVQ